MGAKGYPAEFRRRVIELIDAGRKVGEVAADLGTSHQTIYTWRRQERIDRGLEAGLSTAERAELTAARKRIRELETEIGRPPSRHRAVEGSRRPKRRFAAAKVMAAEGLPVEVACRVLGVSESGYYGWRSRAPSARAIRHNLLTEVIRKVHTDSRCIYGYRRVHAELTLGHGLTVGHEAVYLLMRRAGIEGISGRPRYRRVPNVATASDQVDRQFHRDQPDQLWVTHITEHPTREGKLYCAVVLDVFSRQVVAILGSKRAFPTCRSDCPTREECSLAALPFGRFER